MLTENTISKLREIRLGTMAEAFREQLTNPEISSLSFEDRFGLLVDAEWTTRKNNTLTRMSKRRSLPIHRLASRISRIFLREISIRLKSRVSPNAATSMNTTTFC